MATLKLSIVNNGGRGEGEGHLYREQSQQNNQRIRKVVNFYLLFTILSSYSAPRINISQRILQKSSIIKF